MPEFKPIRSIPALGIIKAIQAHDANAAKEAARVHLKYVEKELLSQIKSNP
jgi:DNA-binding GntR family transcriptional regulator